MIICYKCNFPNKGRNISNFKCQNCNYSFDPSDKKVYVYLLRCNDESIYTGITNNLLKRFNQHLKGIGSKYTRSRGVKLFLAAKDYETRSFAMKEEIRIKKLTHNMKLKLIKEWQKLDNLNI